MADTAEIVGNIVASSWTKEELDEIDAEWLKNGDEIEEKGQAMQARNRSEAKQRFSPVGQVRLRRSR